MKDKYPKNHTKKIAMPKNTRRTDRTATRKKQVPTPKRGAYHTKANSNPKK